MIHNKISGRFELSMSKVTDIISQSYTVKRIFNWNVHKYYMAIVKKAVKILMLQPYLFIVQKLLVCKYRI